MYIAKISSGHSKFDPGAVDLIVERDEARKVTDRVAQLIKNMGYSVDTFHDNTSRTVRDNINTIVYQHNRVNRIMDYSIHFNSFQRTDKPMGVEVLYVNNSIKGKAASLSKSIANALGLPDRGPKYRNNLGFLNGTNKPALLIEVCFVNSHADVRAYRNNFEKLCKAIADGIVINSGYKPNGNTPTTPPVNTNNIPDSKNGKYRVQTGTYANIQAANDAANRIKANGIAGVTYTENDGGRYRVKTGVYANKTSASNAANRIVGLKIAGLATVIPDK